MTRRLTLEWPDSAPFRDRDGAPIRLLAVSDVLEPALVDERNRKAVAPIDLIIGCGDLDCDDLAFIADGFDAPLVYVQGNHDTEERWRQRAAHLPRGDPLDLDPPPRGSVDRRSDLAGPARQGRQPQRARGLEPGAATGDETAREARSDDRHEPRAAAWRGRRTHRRLPPRLRGLPLAARRTWSRPCGSMATRPWQRPVTGRSRWAQQRS